MKRAVWIILGIVVLLALGAYFYRDTLMRTVFMPRESDLPIEEVEGETEVIATDLEVPWEVVFMPGGDILVTERSGFLTRIPQGGERVPVPGVTEVGEGGLLGAALHPDFVNNSFLYLYHTTEVEGGLRNWVVRYVYADGALTNPSVIIDDIPGASYHDGGRIAFGPDGMLYVTTGDAGNPESAQDLDSLSGKILRLNPDGTVPSDNPFGNAVWSYGHRNPQGLAWDEIGNLWATEHGPSGVESGFDEVNLIEAGANYGWPVIRGDETREDMRTPVAHSGASDTWAPAGIVAISEDTLLFAGLRGEALYKLELDAENRVQGLSRILANEYGRMRALVVGPDRRVYATTSNTDGRGGVREEDDRLIILSPDVVRQ